MKRLSRVFLKICNGVKYFYDWPHHRVIVVSAIGKLQHVIDDDKKLLENFNANELNLMVEKIDRWHQLVFFLTPQSIEVRKIGNNLDNPPWFAEWCMMVVIPFGRECEILGSLEEEFHKNGKKIGNKRAKLLYFVQASKIVYHQTKPAMKRLGLTALALAGLKKWIGL